MTSTDLFNRLFELQKVYWESIRRQLDGDRAHPRQAPILGLLLAEDGMSQADLVRKLGVSAATVAVSIARLERLGLVSRQRNMHNQRANILCLTEEGCAEAQRLQDAVCQVCRQALAGFGDADIEQLHAMALRMISHLHAGEK